MLTNVVRYFFIIYKNSLYLKICNIIYKYFTAEFDFRLIGPINNLNPPK